MKFALPNTKQTIFGGSLLKSHPKTARPLDSKLPLHLVLRAERSAMRLPKHFARVNDLVNQVARKYGVRVYEYANCGNHLHALVRIPRRSRWSAFIRELTGRIARRTGVRWMHRPFTRVVNGWRKAYRAVKAYVQLNRLELDEGLSRADARELQNLRRLVAMT